MFQKIRGAAWSQSAGRAAAGRGRLGTQHLTVDLSASLPLAGLQFVDHSTNYTSENTDLDCSPFSSVPFHRQELPLNCRAGNLKKKKKQNPRKQ